jgi:hypothetical protein
MILYHLNYGYPFLDENIEINLPAESSSPRNDYSAAEFDAWNKFDAPRHGIDEFCYYHKLKTDARGWAGYSLYNPNLKKGLSVSYDAAPLDYFIQWKMPGEGDYVLGLEPANCDGESRKTAREKGILKFIEPQEEIKYQFVISFSDERQQG